MIVSIYIFQRCHLGLPICLVAGMGYVLLEGRVSGLLDVDLRGIFVGSLYEPVSPMNKWISSGIFFFREEIPQDQLSSTELPRV